MVRVNLRDDFDIYYKDKRMNVWLKVEDIEKEKQVKEQSYAPPATYTYDVKTIWLGMIENNSIVYYKAKRKPNRMRAKARK